jgi:TPR repeat protein
LRCLPAFIVAAVVIPAGLAPAQASSGLRVAAAASAPAGFLVASGGLDIVRKLPRPAETERSIDPPRPPPGPPPRPAQPAGRLLKFSTADGALLSEAAIAGPADQSGVRAGDILVGINDRPVANPEELRRELAALTPGSQAVVQVWRVAADNGDFVEALRRIAGSGNAHVMFRLGRMYGFGIGVARNDNEAVRWYRQGADAGNTHAMTALAVALFDGRGIDKNEQEAVRLLRSAAARSHVEAMYRLGALLVQGKAIDKDVAEGMRMLTRAADAGFTPAMVDLGAMHNHGLGSIAVDFKAAAAWYRRAADLGNPTAMTSLGYLHQHGTGVDKDDFAAVALYRRAANLGSSQAIHNLGAMYDLGKGVERRDPEQAADLVLRALELRNQFSYQQMTKYSARWSLDFRRALQRKLRDAGLFDGRIDGQIGSSAVVAINAYITRSGRPDERLAQSGRGRSL